MLCIEQLPSMHLLCFVAVSGVPLCVYQVTLHFKQDFLLVGIYVTYTQLHMLTLSSVWHRMKRVLCQQLTSSSRTHGMLRDPCPRSPHRAPSISPLPAGRATNPCMDMVPLSSTSLQSICSTGSSTNSSACCTTSSSSSNTTTSNRSSMLPGTSSVGTNSLCLPLHLCPHTPSTHCSSCNSSQASGSGLP